MSISQANSAQPTLQQNLNFLLNKSNIGLQLSAQRPAQGLPARIFPPSLPIYSPAAPTGASSATTAMADKPTSSLQTLKDLIKKTNQAPQQRQPPATNHRLNDICAKLAQKPLITLQPRPTQSVSSLQCFSSLLKDQRSQQRPQILVQTGSFQQQQPLNQLPLKSDQHSSSSATLSRQPSNLLGKRPAPNNDTLFKDFALNRNVHPRLDSRGLPHEGSEPVQKIQIDQQNLENQENSLDKSEPIERVRNPLLQSPPLASKPEKSSGQIDIAMLLGSNQSDSQSDVDFQQINYHPNIILNSPAVDDCFQEVSEKDAKYLIKILPEHYPQQEVLTGEQIELFKEEYPKIQSDWLVQVVPGHQFDNTHCKFNMGQVPRSKQFMVYHFKKSKGKIDFRIFECLHNRSHTEKCFRTYSNLSKFYDHLRTHTHEKPFVCGFCNEGFGQKGNLIAHIRQKHHKEKKFECPTCHQQFSRKNNMKQHMKTHLKRKPY